MDLISLKITKANKWLRLQNVPQGNNFPCCPGTCERQVGVHMNPSSYPYFTQEFHSGPRWCHRCAKLAGKCMNSPLAYHHISYLAYHRLHFYCRIFGKSWMPRQYIGIQQQLISRRLIPAGKQCDIEHVLEIQVMWPQCARGALCEYKPGFTDTKLTGSIPHIPFLPPGGEICFHILFILSSCQITLGKTWLLNWLMSAYHSCNINTIWFNFTSKFIIIILTSS